MNVLKISKNGNARQRENRVTSAAELSWKTDRNAKQEITKASTI